MTPLPKTGPQSTKIKTLEELGKSIKELKTTIDKKGSYTDAMIVMHTRSFQI